LTLLLLTLPETDLTAFELPMPATPEQLLFSILFVNVISKISGVCAIPAIPLTIGKQAILMPVICAIYGQQDGCRLRK